MIIKSISHNAYRCEDMDKSLDFYCGILGLEKAFELPDASGAPWIVYLKICDGQFIELYYTRPGDPAFTRERTSYSHLCFEVYDINEACETITKAGYLLDRAPKLGSDKNWQAWVVDPDGNRIELMQISPESPQSKT